MTPNPATEAKVFRFRLPRFRTKATRGHNGQSAERTSTSPRARPIRVCMFPRDIPSNECLGLMSDALERTGCVKITNYNFIRSFFSRADLFHVHWVDELVVGVRWPKHIIKVSLFLAYVLLCKMLGRPIVWTVHNVGAHESNYPLLEKILWAVFLPQVAWAIHLCPASTEAIHRLTSTPPKVSIIPHPHYRSVYETCLGSEATRGSRGDAFVFSSFGLIRLYKGFENLSQVFHSWNFQAASLKIAGAPMFKESAQVVNEMLRLSEGDARISFYLRALSRAELRDFVCSSDLVVLPYHKLMNSGVAALALSLGRPILGPAVGCILDYHQRLGSDWVLLYENELTVEDLKRAHDKFQGRDRSVLPDLEWMAPDRIAAQTLNLYQQHILKATWDNKSSVEGA
jgi:beta-1,4-mannosyltransferase